MTGKHRFTTAAAVAIALGAASPAAAQEQDLRAPDTKDAAECGSITQCGQRPPDLRTPDAIDAASPRPASTPAPTRVRIVEVPSRGFEWGDAGIGAAGALAVIALGAGVGMAGAQRRRSRHVTAGTR
jgi:hypothetical protein